MLRPFGFLAIVPLVFVPFIFVLFASVMSTAVTFGDDFPFAEDAKSFKPDQSLLEAKPPSGAITLFDGNETMLFRAMNGETVNWKIDDGALISNRGKGRSNHIVSTLHFRDADIHVEFMLPEKGTGNSGIYIHGNYELQIFNSHGKTKLNQGDMGAVYGFAAPLVNAAKLPGEWQVYDIRYRAPRRDQDGNIVQEGSITAWLNGKRVQEGTRFGEPRSTYHPYRYGTTPYLQEIGKQQKSTMIGPVFLQDHDNPVKFRHVWVRPLDDKTLIYAGSENSTRPE
jgi:hypothetical protein